MTDAATLYLAIRKITDYAPEGYLRDHMASHLAHLYWYKAVNGETVYYAAVHQHIETNLSQNGFHAEAIDAVAGLIFDTYSAIHEQMKVAA